MNIQSRQLDLWISSEALKFYNTFFSVLPDDTSFQQMLLIDDLEKNVAEMNDTLAWVKAQRQHIRDNIDRLVSLCYLPSLLLASAQASPSIQTNADACCKVAFGG